MTIPIMQVRLVVHDSGYTDDRKESANSATEAADILTRYIGDSDREQFVVLLLDARNKVIGIHTVSQGTLSASLVHPREVFKVVLLANAASIIIGHNHPSGDPAPSVQDKAVTLALKQAAALLDIPLLDHIIVTPGGRSYSFAASGLL